MGIFDRFDKRGQRRLEAANKKTSFDTPYMTDGARRFMKWEAIIVAIVIVFGLIALLIR